MIFRSILYVLAMLVLVGVIGGILLEQFPSIQPLWEEFKAIFGELYESSKIKYGSIATIVLFIAVAILFGTSSSKL